MADDTNPTKRNGACNIRQLSEMELPAVRSCSVRELNAASVMQILCCLFAPSFSLSFSLSLFLSFSFSLSLSFFLSFSLSLSLSGPRLTEPKRKSSHHYLQISYLSISMSRQPGFLCTCARLHRRRHQRRFHSAPT